MRIGGARVLTPITHRIAFGTVNTMANGQSKPDPDLPSTLAIGLYYFDKWCQHISSGRIGVCKLHNTIGNILFGISWMWQLPIPGR